MRKFTGQDIHAAFVYASNEEGKPPLIDLLADWDCVNAYSQARYECMANYLNQQAEQESQPVKQEIEEK